MPKYYAALQFTGGESLLTIEAESEEEAFLAAREQLEIVIHHAPRPNKLRVLVCGGRDYNDYETLKRELCKLTAGSEVTVISGCARGADTLAIRWAEDFGHEVERFPADWAKHGKSAGYKRNVQMLEESKPHMVIAFPGGKGTAHMVSEAVKRGIPWYNLGGNNDDL